MRIRKHAKISPLVYAASSLKPGTLLQTHVCQLNQSPWDVANFSPPQSPPPPPPQVDGDGVCAGNGSLARCVSVVQSKEQQREYSDDLAAAAEEEPPPSPENEAEIIICCKTDGKSWQCRNEASSGNSLCDHHLSQAKSYSSSSSSYHVAKKPEVRRARPKKALTPSSNPYEFYYYSGFGPRWGKKRGEPGKNSASNGGNYMTNKNVEHGEDGIERPTSSDEYEDDDDDEDDEDENRDDGKKRVRKPIKARSLKSLM